MEQFIPKSALVAEIERLENKNCKNSNDFNLGAATYLGMLKQFINTHEVKEVDLEKEMTEEIDNYWFDNCDGYIQRINGEEMKIEDVKDIARHFFELGMAVSNKA